MANVCTKLNFFSSHYSSAAPAGVQQAGAPPGAPPIGVQAGAQVPQQLTTNNVVQPTAQPTVVVATAAGIEPRTTSVSGPPTGGAPQQQQAVGVASEPTQPMQNSLATLVAAAEQQQQKQQQHQHKLQSVGIPTRITSLNPHLVQHHPPPLRMVQLSGKDSIP